MKIEELTRPTEGTVPQDAPNLLSLFSAPGDKCVLRSPDLGSSYLGAFPFFNSGTVPFRPHHGYWDSPAVSAVFPEYL